MNSSRIKINIYFIFVLFSLSGFSGLIYESVWTHYIKLILGHAAYAQTLVLSTFMGGLALGAWLISRKSEYVQRPLIWYIGIELILGTFGIFFHYEFLAANHLLFENLLPFVNSPFLATSLKWLVAFLLLIPQALLLGTTFPLIGAAIIRLHVTRPGESLSILYFSNSMGAVIGILVSGFVLIEMVGLPGTSLTAGVINILLAVTLWLVSGGIRGAMNQPRTPTLPTRSTEPQNGSPDRLPQILLGVALFTGLSSFFYEIAWIRMLSLVLGSSMQSFELMLSAFILGLALGGWYIRKRADSLIQPVVTLGWIQMLMGLFAVLTLPVYAKSFDFMAFLISALEKTDSGYTLFNLSSHFIAALVMVPATFMAGMTLPLITTILVRSAGGERAIGRVYAANTLGAIAGIVLAINLLMPAIGATNLVVLGALIDIAIGIFLLHRILGKHLHRVAYLGPIAGLLSLSILFSITPFSKSMLASGVYRLGNSTLPANGKAIYYEDGRTATISFFRFDHGSASISTNGKSDALINGFKRGASADEYTMISLGTLPLIYKPDIEYAANIGLGSGLTSHVLLGSEKIKELESIEIEKEVVNAAKNFGDRVSRTFSDPRSKIIVDDAKSYFSSRKSKYDAIISEPSNPWVSGVASLFTVEYYQQIDRSLKDGGIFVQWLQLYEIGVDGVMSVLKAIDSGFKHYVIYNADDGNFIIIASNTNTLTRTHADIFNNTELSKELDRIKIHRKSDFEIRMLGSEKSLAEYIRFVSAPMNSDFFPYLSYAAPKSRFKFETSSVLADFHITTIPMVNWLNGKRPPADLPEQGNFFSYFHASKNALHIASGNFQFIGNPKVRWAATHLASSNFTCSPDATGNHDDIEALITIGGSVNPYLPTDQLGKFWRKAGAVCRRADESNVSRRTWLLQQAISRYDADRVLILTEQLLSGEKKFERNTLNNILLARLVAAYQAGDRKAAITTVMQYNLAARFTELELPFQWIVSLILSMPPAR